MKPDKLLELFRLEVDDTITPYLWSDDEFYAYLSEAQDLHISVVGGISDRTSAFTKLTYKADDQFLTYDSRIIRIKGAWNEDKRRIDVKNIDNFDHGFLHDDYGLSELTGLDDSRTGPIEAIITDVEDYKIQLYPIPEDTGYIQLYVARRPLADVDENTQDLEVPEQYHLNLLNWVKYKAYHKQDVETFNGTKAVDFRNEFTTGLVLAKKNKMAREDRKRTVVYGGIPMA